MSVDQSPITQDRGATSVARKPFVFVLGVPSGGTSCVAHVLRQLGVDMGRIPNEFAPHGRDYSTCEDRDCFARAVNQFVPWGRPLPTTDARRAAEITARYVAWRRQQPTSSPFLGCKGWINWAVADERFWQIPDIRVVRVHRPLEACIASFLRYQRLAPRQTKRDLLRHAAYLTVQWTVNNEFVEARDEVLEVEFERLCKDPPSEIRRLAAWLPLNAADEQLQRAINHVRNPQAAGRKIYNAT